MTAWRGVAERTGMDARRPFKDWLRTRRHQLDLTQGALAKLASCSTDMIRKLEAGRARPSRHLAGLLALHLQLTPAEQEAFVAAACGRSTRVTTTADDGSAVQYG